jgi:hypothetical protein
MTSRQELIELIMEKLTFKNAGYAISAFVCFIFWRLDSAYGYLYKILGIENERI